MAELAKAKLAEQGYGVWLPMCRVLRKKNRRWVKVERPLFPRFLFCGMTTEQPFPPILVTPGVHCVLRGASMIPIEVPHKDLQEIKARVDADGGTADFTPPPPNKRWKKGQRLTVQDGPFGGYSGEFLWANENRVKILLDILGRPTIFECEPDQVIGASNAPGLAEPCLDTV